MEDIRFSEVTLNFCGTFHYEEYILNNQWLLDNFVQFDNPNKNHFTNIYYPNFLNAFKFHDYDKFKKDAIKQFSSNQFDLKYLPQNLSLSLKNREIVSIEITHTRIYFINQKLGLFSFGVNIDERFSSTRYLSEIIYQLREIGTIGGSQTEGFSSLKYIEKNILLDIISTEDKWNEWRKINQKLKSFVYVNTLDKLSDDNINTLLYELGSAVPANTVNGEEDFTPSNEYFESLIENNTLNIFKHWKSIALFDSFITVCNKFDKTMQMWQNEYFYIYLYALFTKYYLLDTYQELTLASNDLKKLIKLRNSFIQFSNDFDLSHISNKFLQNSIYQKMRVGLDLVYEIKKIDERINKITLLNQERAEVSDKRNLSAITLLTTISIINDGMTLIFNHDSNEDEIVRWTKIITPVLLFFIVAFLYIKQSIGDAD